MGEYCVWFVVVVDVYVIGCDFDNIVVVVIENFCGGKVWINFYV